MKIFLEGEQSQMYARVGVLKPGVNDVPDDVGKALVEGCAAYCAMVRKTNPDVVQLFRMATEDDEPKLVKQSRDEITGPFSIAHEPAKPAKK
jgi:hypothetical protein